MEINCPSCKQSECVESVQSSNEYKYCSNCDVLFKENQESNEKPTLKIVHG